MSNIKEFDNKSSRFARSKLMSNIQEFVTSKIYIDIGDCDVSPPPSIKTFYVLVLLVVLHESYFIYTFCTFLLFLTKSNM